MAFKYNFRGVVGKDFTIKDIKSFARGAIDYIYSKQLSPMVILAKDNRVTGDYILSVLQSELLLYGVGVYLLSEPATTPELVFLTKKFKFGLGIMVTASHNASEYNGIKCFSKSGYPVIIKDVSKKNCKNKKYAKLIYVNNFKDLYLNELKTRIRTIDANVIFDCANGSATYIVRSLLPKNRIVGTELSGQYINNDFGTEHIHNLRARCTKHNAIGFAFDGDADRVIAVDEDGSVIDGDKILFILASQNLGLGDVVVGTQVTSMALERSLGKLGIKLIRTNVGSQYVVECMKERNARLGGENCGHIFNNLNYSDGIGVAIELINIISRTGKTFKQLLSEYEHTFIQSSNIDYIDNVDEVDIIENNMHIIVRKSRTENKVRLMVEGYNEREVRFKHEQMLNILHN